MFTEFDKFDKLSDQPFTRYFQLRVLSTLENLAQYVLDYPFEIGLVRIDTKLLNVYNDLLRQIYEKSSTD